MLQPPQSIAPGYSTERLNHPASYALLLIPQFFVFPRRARAHLVWDLFVMLRRPIPNLVIKHTHLSNHLWNITSSSYPTDSACVCVCVRARFGAGLILCFVMAMCSNLKKYHVKEYIIINNIWRPRLHYPPPVDAFCWAWSPHWKLVSTYMLRKPACPDASCMNKFKFNVALRPQRP